MTETANALHEALAMPSSERETQAARLQEVVASRTPADWLKDQVAAADS